MYPPSASVIGGKSTLSLNNSIKFECTRNLAYINRYQNASYLLCNRSRTLPSSLNNSSKNCRIPKVPRRVIPIEPHHRTLIDFYCWDKILSSIQLIKQKSFAWINHYLYFESPSIASSYQVVASYLHIFQQRL